MSKVDEKTVVEEKYDVERDFMITFDFALRCSPEAMDHYRNKIIEDSSDPKLLPENISEEEVFRKICDSDLCIYVDNDDVEVTERVINSIDW